MTKAKRRSYAVKTTFTLCGKFFVCAKDEDDARNMVESRCYRIDPKTCTKLPLKEVGWDFSYTENHSMETGVVSLLKDGRYAVETRFVNSGTFWVAAESRDEARQTVEVNCSQRSCSHMQSTLPSDKVSWRFPRKPQISTGRVFLQKQRD